MPRPSLRSRSLRKMKIRIPGGASVVHYLRRNPSKAKCGSCGKALHGVASGRPKAMQKASKTAKTVSRKYGGSLCASCVRSSLKAAARSSSK